MDHRSLISLVDVLQTTFFGFSLLNIIAWVVFGFFAGLVIHFIDPGDVRGGFFGTTLLGILGAIVGGLLSRAFFGVNYTALNIRGFITAVIGALVLALASRLLFRKNEHIKTESTRLR